MVGNLLGHVWCLGYLICVTIGYKRKFEYLEACLTQSLAGGTLCSLVLLAYKLKRLGFTVLLI